MKIDEVRTIARQQNIKPGKLPKAELIRTIQRAEGNFDCFDTNSSKTCGQEECLWREDCD